MRLGKNQIDLLRGIGTHGALVVPNRMSRRLCDLGLLRSDSSDGSFAYITSAGLRALADAVDDGKIELFKMPKKTSAKPES